jgi:hypothetical protein
MEIGLPDRRAAGQADSTGVVPILEAMSVGRPGRVLMVRAVAAEIQWTDTTATSP